MKPGASDTELSREIRDYLIGQRDWVIATLSDLVAYPSTSGHETAVMAYIERQLSMLSGELLKVPVPDDLGGDVDFSPAPTVQPYADRPNLINLRRGRGGGRSLILCAHSDVVPADWPEAFAPRLEGDVLFGRGASDDKGPLVSGLLALRALDHLGIELRGDLEMQVVIEEETGGNGTLAVILAGRRADGVVVLECADMDVHPAGRGALWFRIDVEGKSTHMAYIREGVNAAKEAFKIIQALERYEQRLIDTSRDNPLFARYAQPVMVNIGMLSSGDWPSTVPAHATIEGGVGFLPNRNLDIVRREIREAILDGTGEWVRDHHKTTFDRLHNEAYQLAADHPLAVALYGACLAAGLTSEVCGMVASCDARLYYHRGGMAPVVFGPGYARYAHSRQEQVKISDVIGAAEALVYLTRNWCGW